MALEIGVFIVPDATDHERTVAQAVAADRVGLDLVAIQDHPYQRRFLDTRTLLSYLAARTEQVRLIPDVINLPLRLPTRQRLAAEHRRQLPGAGGRRRPSRGSRRGREACRPRRWRGRPDRERGAGGRGRQLARSGPARPHPRAGW